MIHHAFVPRPVADQRLLSAYPRCAQPNCGGAQHEHVELDADFLAAFYGFDDAHRRIHWSQTDDRATDLPPVLQRFLDEARGE